MIKTVARKLAEIIGTGFYSGYFPIAPGTVGSAVGVAIYLVFARLGVLTASSPLRWVALAAVVFVAGWLSAWQLEQRWGRDHKRIVIDEIWGMLLALALLPARPGYIIAAFLLFRFFDIVKPFPARRAEKLGRGVGVMLDDGIVGLYANLLIHVARLMLR